MLYRIKDKTGLVIGVHECSPVEVRGYLSTLPRQSAPYSAQALPSSERPFRDAVNHAIEGWSVLRGVVIGLVLAQPLDIGLYFILHHYGVL